MRCISEIKLKTGIAVPCGQCYICKFRHVNQWGYRLQVEANNLNTESVIFATLTYDNNNIKRTKNNYKTLDKQDVVKFIKDLRRAKNGDKKTNIKYYVVGEYGSKTKRPHYHAILFNCTEAHIQRAWNKGYTDIGTITQGSIFYTLKYVNKRHYKPQHSKDDRQPEFSLKSKGIGAQYLTQKMINYHKADKLNNCYVKNYNGTKIPLPRYYKDKIFTKHQKLSIYNEYLQKELDRQKLLTQYQRDQEHKIYEQVAYKKQKMLANALKNQILKEKL